jgi:hypothetical protein
MDSMPVEDVKNKTWGTISGVITFILFIVAVVAWMQVKQINTNVEQTWADPLQRDSTLKLAKSAQNLTFLVWVVPLLLGLIGFVFMMSKNKKAEKVETMYQKSTSRKSVPYSCDVPKYSRAY